MVENCHCFCFRERLFFLARKGSNKYYAKDMTFFFLRSKIMVIFFFFSFLSYSCFVFVLASLFSFHFLCLLMTCCHLGPGGGALRYIKYIGEYPPSLLRSRCLGSSCNTLGVWQAQAKAAKDNTPSLDDLGNVQETRERVGHDWFPHTVCMLWMFPQFAILEETTNSTEALIHESFIFTSALMF